MGKWLKVQVIGFAVLFMGFIFFSIAMTGDEINVSGTLEIDTGLNYTLDREKVQVFLSRYPYLADKLSIFESVAKKNNISVVLMIAIIVQETGGNSHALTELNNPSGQMTSEGLIHFDTLEEGLEMTGRTLNNLVNERGLNTLVLLGSVYCPVGASNDPLGLNANWVPNVQQFIDEMGGTLVVATTGSAIPSSQRAKKMLEFAESNYRKGVVYTQGAQRGTFPYFDCSAFVTKAMSHAGVPIELGSTETLYNVEGTLLEPITKEQVKAGDIFVWGTKGASSGDYGHTGFFTDSGTTIIHCTPATTNGFGQDGDVVKTPFEGYYGNSSLAPVYFYRVK